MSRAVRVLPNVKTDLQRYAWTRALRAFCESVREYVSASAVVKAEEVGDEHLVVGNQVVKGPEIVQQNYADQMELAYDAVYGWLSAKDIKVFVKFCLYINLL